MTQVLDNIGQKFKIAAYFDVAKAATKLPEGQVEVIVSSPSLDRQGESIKIDGIDYTGIQNNGPVMWSHDYESAPIGKILKLWKQAGNLKARVELDMGDAFGAEVYRKVVAGFIKAVSIGGIVREFGKNTDGTIDFMTIAKMEMIELSFCAIGANPDALVSLKSLEPGIFKTSEENSDDFIRKSIEVLQHQVSALESAYDATRVPEKPTLEQKIVARRNIVLAKTATNTVDRQAEMIAKALKQLLEKDSQCQIIKKKK